VAALNGILLNNLSIYELTVCESAGCRSKSLQSISGAKLFVLSVFATFAAVVATPRGHRESLFLYASRGGPSLSSSGGTSRYRLFIAAIRHETTNFSPSRVWWSDSRPQNSSPMDYESGHALPMECDV
jgi:hypothetical protein